MVDYFDSSKTISIKDIDIALITLVGKREKILEAGAFQATLCDIDLFERMKSLGYQWKRLSEITCRYFFGRCADSISLQVLAKQRI